MNRIVYAIVLVLAACGGTPDRPAELGPQHADAGAACDHDAIASAAFSYDANGVGTPVPPAKGCVYLQMFQDSPPMAAWCCPQ
jgi:hypothetical protein